MKKLANKKDNKKQAAERAKLQEEAKAGQMEQL